MTDTNRAADLALHSDEGERYITPVMPAPGDEAAIRLRTGHGYEDEVRLLSGELCLRMERVRSDEAFDWFEARHTLGEEPFRYVFEVTGGGRTRWYGKTGVSADRTEAENEPFGIYPGFRVPDWARGAVMYQIFTDRFRRGEPDSGVRDGEYEYIGLTAQRSEDWNAPVGRPDVHRFYGGNLPGVAEKLDYLEDLGVEAIYFNPLFLSPSNHRYDTQDYGHIDPHLTPAGAAEDTFGADRYQLLSTDPAILEAADQYFADLAEEIHRRGMRLIMDGVFNHCGSFHYWMDRERIYEGRDGYARGAYLAADSPWRDRFRFREERWPENDSYEAWWDFETLPKLDYEGSATLADEICAVGAKWVSLPWRADGWRLDVAADLGHSEAYNHGFWKQFRRAVREANPEALIVAEHYGDPAAWLGSGEWDSVMNYDAFMEPVTWFLTGMEKHSGEFKEERLGDGAAFEKAMRRAMARFPTLSLQCAMNELSNHDHSRFLTRTNHRTGPGWPINGEAAAAPEPEAESAREAAAQAGTGVTDFGDGTGYDTGTGIGTGNGYGNGTGNAPASVRMASDPAAAGVQTGIFRAGVLMQMTLPGCPTVYYGDEAGQVGFTDPDNRRTYPWGREDEELIEFHRCAIRLHRAHPALRTGSFVFLAAEKDLVAYGRFDENEQLVTVVSLSEVPRTADIEVWPAETGRQGTMTCLIETWRGGYAGGGADGGTGEGSVKTAPVCGGVLHVTLGPQGAAVYASRQADEA